MSFLKKNKIIIFVLVGIAVLSAGALWLSCHYVVPIMMYHHVADVTLPRADTVSPNNFESHLQFLKKHNYNIISFDHYVEQASRGKSFPYKTVVITFDDGYKDNYTQAFPILDKYGFTATFFVAPGDIANDQKNIYMNFEELKEMIQAGMSVGSHGMTQAYLPKMSQEKQDSEIFASKKKLENILGIPICHFAYPIGGFNRSIKKRIYQAGYKSASTTNRGYDKYNKDMYEINRIRFSDKDNSDIILWTKLTGFYNFFRKSKDPY